MRINVQTVHSTSDASHAVDYWRVLLPIMAISEYPGVDAGFNLENPDITYSSYSEQPDINLNNWIVSLDDNLWHIDQDQLNPLVENVTDEQLTNIYNNLSQARCVVASSELIAQDCRDNGIGDVVVMPNYIDMRVFEVERLKMLDFHIFYYGTSTHLQDLVYTGCLDALKRVMRESDTKVYLHVIGELYLDELLSQFPEGQLNVIPPSQHFPDFLDKFRHFAKGADLAVIPLQDTRYNNSKSLIKYLELSSAKVPTIVSNADPYRHINTTKTENTENDWFNALNQAISNPEILAKQAQESYLEVRENYTIQQHRQDWFDLFEFYS